MYATIVANRKLMHRQIKEFDAPTKPIFQNKFGNTQPTAASPSCTKLATQAGVFTYPEML